MLSEPVHTHTLYAHPYIQWACRAAQMLLDFRADVPFLLLLLFQLSRLTYTLSLSLHFFRMYGYDTIRYNNNNNQQQPCKQIESVDFLK